MCITIKCAWCGLSMGNKECEGQIDKAYRISHSICPECKEKVMREIDEGFVQNPNNQNQNSERRGYE